MLDYLATGWSKILEHNGLGNFDALWNLKAEWFEPPNERRGGWSGVVRLELRLPDGGSEGVFLKRQENHRRRTLRHPFGEPTFAGEMQNILRLQRAEVPTLEPVYYAQRKVNGRWRAILMTRELKDFRPLNWWLEQWQATGWATSRPIRQAVLKEAAWVIRRLHKDAGLVHNALHPKHLFVKVSDERGVPKAEARLIDLEKMRPAMTSMRAARRDLDSFNRRCLPLSLADRMRFLACYLGTRHLSSEGRGLWRHLSNRMLAARKERAGG